MTRSHSAGVAHHAGDPLAQRDDLAAGQGGRLEQVVGLVLAGPDDRVGEDHAALGVGVEHLDPLAAVHGDHVAGPVRASRRSCSRPSGGRRSPPPRAPAPATASMVAATAAAPAMSDFISHMPWAGLIEIAAGVERDALADQGHLLAVAPVPGCSASLHQPRRRPSEPMPTARMPPYPPVAQRLLVEHLDVEAGVPRPPRRPRRRSAGGRRSLGGGVDPVPGAGDRPGHHRGALDLRLGRLVGRVRHVQRARPRPGRGGPARLGLVAGEPVRAEQRALGDARAAAGPASRAVAAPAAPAPPSPCRPAPAPRRRRPGAVSRAAGTAPVGSAPRPTAATTGADRAQRGELGHLAARRRSRRAAQRLRQLAVERDRDALRPAAPAAGGGRRRPALCRCRRRSRRRPVRRGRCRRGSAWSRCGSVGSGQVGSVLPMLAVTGERCRT